MTKVKRQTPKSVLKEVCLRAGGIWRNGACFGGHCENCLGEKMDARGLKFAHIKRRKMGGTTSPEIHSPENVKRLCYVCDEENDGVRLPHSKPVDKPFMGLSGCHGTGFGSYSKAQQTGIKKKG